MTKLNAVKIGMNKFCGPAVLSILTGKSTDECAHVISSINGQYHVEGVQLTDLLKAADKLGFTNQPKDGGSSLYTTLVKLVNDDGMYIVTVTNHFVVIEVNDKKIYFCDNHTKEPMPAASSARMLQKVMAVHKVIRRREPQLVSSKIVSEKILIAHECYCVVRIYEQLKYDMPGHNKSNLIGYVRFETQEAFREFLASLTEGEKDG